jgi:hypothetical protein
VIARHDEHPAAVRVDAADPERAALLGKFLRQLVEVGIARHRVVVPSASRRRRSSASVDAIASGVIGSRSRRTLVMMS